MLSLGHSAMCYLSLIAVSGAAAGAVSAHDLHLVPHAAATNSSSALSASGLYLHRRPAPRHAHGHLSARAPAELSRPVMGRVSAARRVLSALAWSAPGGARGVTGGGRGRQRDAGQLLSHGELRPGEEAAPHLDVGRVRPPGVALLPVEGGAHRVTGRDLVRVFDELFGENWVGPGNVLKLLLRLVNSGGQQGLSLLQLSSERLKRHNSLNCLKKLVVTLIC